MNLRKIFRNISLGENMVYALVWAIIYLIPFMNAHLMSEEAVDFGKVVISWAKITPYFAIFLVHNYCLSPLLLRNRYGWYIVLLLLLVASIFGTIDVLDIRYWQSNESLRDKASLTELAWYWNVLFGILMAGANSMIKLYYRAISTEQRMAVLERENIESQMQYLKYQINPHFLMNTLNNIHALVDIDGEAAKQTVIQLSDMMRYVVYDASDDAISLKEEVKFIENYIELMRIRYTDDVKILYNKPEQLSGRVEIPPLIFIVFVENAFKHGVSYDNASYIYIDIKSEDGYVVGRFENSVNPTKRSDKPGIGLENVRKRLDLIYNDDYDLQIEETDNSYCITLKIPTLNSYEMHRN